MVCATKNTFNMMHSPIIYIHGCCTGLLLQVIVLYMLVLKMKGLCILLKLCQFPSLKSVCVVSLQTVLCKQHIHVT